MRPARVSQEHSGRDDTLRVAVRCDQHRHVGFLDRTLER
jgi:hypothetical protein